MEYKLIENELIPIYENEKRERSVDARELHEKLGNKRKFADWIKQRIDQYRFIENIDFFKRHNFVKIGNLTRPQIDYELTINTAKELAMVENNEIGRKIRRYFIEVEKRYQTITSNPMNIFDCIRLALNQIEANQNEIQNVKALSENNTKQIEEIQSKIDVTIKKDYCLASDIAEQLKLYSESGLPHSNLVGAIARQLGYKTSYKHYYEDEYIAIAPDISKGNDFWQIYYKPNAVEQITNWFKENKQELEYAIVYQKNTKSGIKGEIKEKGFKIDDICYKIM
jgi:phage anti-repressor protein